MTSCKIIFHPLGYRIRILFNYVYPIYCTNFHHFQRIFKDKFNIKNRCEYPHMKNIADCLKFVLSPNENY